MSERGAWLAAAAGLAALVHGGTARADSTLTFDGDVPQDALEHFFVPFEVPAGIAEIEVRHDDLSDANILDFGLNDPNGYRGWGGGTSEPAVVGVKAASRAYVPGPLPAGTWKVVVGKAKVVETPGKYHLEVVLRQTATLAPQTDRRPYAPAAPLAKEARWYAGDFHVHSKESTDAKPALGQIAAFAQGAGLDFVEISDHNTITQDDYLVDLQAAHPRLLVMPGIEFTSYHGHGNAIGATKWVDHKIGQPGVTIGGAVDQIHAQGALFALNHPALDLGNACIGCAWKQPLAAEKIDAIEIGTGGWKQAGFVFDNKAIAMWDDLCAQGRHVAAIGGSDDHSGGNDSSAFHSPIGNPTTMVFASELSAAGILAGIKAGRTVVKLQGPGDPMIELDSAEPREDERVSALHVTLRAKVTGGAGQKLVFVQDGRAGDPIAVAGDPFTAELALTPPPSGETRVRAEVWVDDNPRTVTSHLWLRTGPDYAPKSGGGCGCEMTKAPRPLGWTAALVVLVALLRRRRRHILPLRMLSASCLAIAST